MVKSKIDLLMDEIINGYMDTVSIYKKSGLEIDYSAIKKEYHYLLSTNEYSPFETNYIFQYGRPLDLELMREAAKIFIPEKVYTFIFR